MRMLFLFLGLLFAGKLLAADSAYVEIQDTLHTSTGDLYGSLTLPVKGKGKMPVALLIAGSGPTDRNGNTPLLPGKNNSLLYLAQELAAKGIATLRYDKRGIAASVGAGVKEEDLRFDHYVVDAKAWVAQLRKDPRFSQITIIGHSEGSLIGMLAADGADRFVSLCGAGITADSLIRKQLAGIPPAVRESAYQTMDSLKQGMLVQKPSIFLMSLFRPSVQPYMISWFRHDPKKAIAALTIPVLIAQGDNDAQVSVSDAETLKAACPKAQLLLLKDMNHVLKVVESKDPKINQQAYSDPSLKVAPKLVSAIAVFIRKGK
ncbi:MAG: alpha/beta fold hydrolase [Chitinophagaceae bacterium]|nr:MAG: alpha/beta fold hydrolase [Chitinophagaceae bacterium]